MPMIEKHLPKVKDSISKYQEMNVDALKFEPGSSEGVTDFVKWKQLLEGEWYQGEINSDGFY